MSKRQLEYLKSVAMYGSLREAARKLYISEATISQQLHDLEKKVGFSLFERRGRYLHLTEVGHSLLPDIDLILASYQKFDRHIQEIQSPTRGIIRMGAIPSMASTLLADLLPQFKFAWPHVELEIHEGGTRELVESLKRHDLDIVVAAESPLVPLVYVDLISRCLFKTELQAVVSTRHRLSHKKGITKEDLMREHFVLLRRGYLARDLVFAVLGTGVEQHIMFSADNTESIRNVIKMGSGICFLPKFLLAHWTANQTEGLAVLDLEDHWFDFEQVCLYSKYGHRPTYLESFINFVVKTGRNLGAMNEVDNIKELIE